VLPKDPQAAIELLASTLRPSEVYVVHAENGSVVATGIVTGRGPVLRADREVLTAAWGRWGGLWRFALVRALRLEGARRDTVSIEGLVVREECRGSGLGSALLERIIADAAEEGFSAVTLDVGDDNPRARRLYERHGFIVERKLWVPPVLRGEARFRHLIFMRLELTAGARANAG
jgi:ribosomal protein S18 acetylase RimI-like enzyme